MECFLLIDGGGSKTEFALSDKEGEILRSVTVAKGTNPWKHPRFAGVEEVLKDGLDQLNITEDIVACVAGMSGCHGDSKFKPDFENVIRPYINDAPLLVTGDIITSFRALSDRTAGVLAINGSGSSIALLYEDGDSYIFDAVGSGGRDIAVNLILSAQGGYYSKEFEQWIESVIGEPVAGLSIPSMYENPRIYSVAKELTELPADHPIRIEVAPYIYSVAVRWVVKIWGAVTKYRNVAKMSSDDVVTVVLNGGVWRFDDIRETTISLLKDAHLSILYDAKTSPIIGAIKLAKELITQK